MSNQRKTVRTEPVGPMRTLADGRTEQDVIHISVFYSKGGLSYFTYQQEKRGYWLSVTPKTIERSPGQSYHVERTMLMSGLKKFLEETARFSQKTLDRLATAAAETDIEAMKAAVLAKGVTA